MSTTGGTAGNTVLSGNIEGNQGLVLQGYATDTSHVSELVLAGTVATSGTPAVYSYGTATSPQNFVNGPGGIGLGTTGLQGATAVVAPTLPSGAAVNGAEGFVRFSGANSLEPGAVGNGYVAAIRKAGTGKDGDYGYLLTGTSGSGTTYQLPEGKTFVIGSLGTGQQDFGTLGVAGGGTATLLGSSGLTGAAAGSVNVHANADADNQSLDLLARAATDDLILGSAANTLVFTPTTGDSGAANAYTALQDRTGATTLNKVGLGTLDIEKVAYNKLDGTTSVRSSVTWNVSAGTLIYNQNDTTTSAAPFSSVSIAGGATYGGTGTLNTSAFTPSSGSAIIASISSDTSYTKINVSGNAGVTLTGVTLTFAPLAFTPTANTVYKLIDNTGAGSITGAFSNYANGAAITLGSIDFKIFYNGGDGNDVILVEASRPTTVYVSNNDFGLGSAPAAGIVFDGDTGLAGIQTAVAGINTFASLGAGLSAVASSGAVVLNAGTGTYAESANLMNGVTLRITGGNVALSDLDSALGTTINLQAHSLTIGQDVPGSHTLAGAIQGSGNFTKTGSDSLTITGSSNYTGGTSVTGSGTLLVDSDSASTNVAVGGSATLGGGNSVSIAAAGSMIVSGTLAPGIAAGLGSVGTIKTGNLTLGGTLAIDLMSITSADQIEVTSANISGAVLSLNIGTINDNEKYTILKIDGGASASGTFTGLAEGGTITVGGRTFKITYNGGDSGHDVVLTAQTNGVAALASGFPALNANPHDLPQYAYIAHPGQHSMIESVVYSFSSSVSLSRSDFTITNKGPANIGGSNFAAYVPDLVVTGADNNTLWTVTFANHVIGGVEQPDGVSDTTGSIGDGKYELVLNAASGLTSTYDFYRLLGDVNHKGTVDGDNFQAFITAFNQTPGTALYVGAFDFDGGYLNPTVNGADFQTLVTNFNHTVGDITGFN